MLTSFTTEAIVKEREREIRRLQRMREAEQVRKVQPGRVARMFRRAQCWMTERFPLSGVRPSEHAAPC